MRHLTRIGTWKQRGNPWQGRPHGRWKHEGKVWRLGCYLAVLAACLCLPGVASAESREVRIPVGEDRVLNGTLYVPPGPGLAPGILVLHTSGGLQSADLAYAADLAQEGFVSLAIHYLNPRWEGKFHHPGYIRDLVLVVDFLQARPEVQGRPVGVVGFSLGSKGVLLAARHPGIKAVVSYYGVYDLRILPQTRGRSSYPTMPVDVAAEVGAPVLLLHGEWDDETPLSQAEAMRDALLKAGKVVELVVYSKAYHRFDRGPASGTSSGRTREGYTYRLDEKAKQDAWTRTLSWFRKYLTALP